MPRKSKLVKEMDENDAEYGKVLTAKRDHVIPAAYGIRYASRNYDSNDWRRVSGSQDQYQGVYVFAPVDPYSNSRRKEFRSAVSNAYVYRANRMHTSFVCGQGYTTTVVPRLEEELPEEQEEAWAQTFTVPVPYFGNKPMTAEQIKDIIDKKAKELKLDWNIFNAYFVALEQGRCVLALTPLEKDHETDKWKMPEMIRLIRTEFTLRPLLDNNTGDLKGVYAVGVRSEERNSVIPAERMIYIMHAFNNELFSDYYGDSKVARISDIANSLNVILNQDYPNAAKNTWYKPRTLWIPVPPQEAGNEQTIATAIANQINAAEGKDVVLTGPSNKEDLPPQVLPTGNYADINGLETMRTGLIKAIVTAYGIPGFLLSEGDYGTLGANSNLPAVDMYLNTEISGEKIMLEAALESQFYDRMLCILFDTEDYEKIPIKIKHHFNKPKLLTLAPPGLYEELKQMVMDGIIDPEGLREVLGLTELDKETMSEGSNPSPEYNQTDWPQTVKSPIQINLWPGQNNEMKTTTSAWGAMPKGFGKPADKKENGQTVNTFDQARDKIDSWRKKKSIPTKEDLNDPKLRVEWAKIKEARKVRRAMEDDNERTTQD